MNLKHILISLLAVSATSCLGDGSQTLVFAEEPSNKKKDPTEADNLGIPKDDEATDAPDINDDEQNTDIPNAPTIVITKGAYGYIPMTGIKNKDGNWLTLKGTSDSDQNTWLTIDGDTKAVDLIETKSAWAQNSFRTPTDVVFIVNNSRSMTEEIDVLAEGISGWVERVSAHGIDLRVGCVGYAEGVCSINGAIDLADPKDIIDYLHREDITDESRVKGFEGDNADMLEAASMREEYINDFANECEVLALRYANDLFSFRSNSNRIYINFTDEPNQPGKRSQWSVEVLKPQNGYWTAADGTVYSVYSGIVDFPEVPLVTEKPWLMSEYTGGIAQFCSNDFSGVSLLNLEATEAITNSCLIRFRTVAAYNDGRQHKVKITINTPDGTKAEKTMSLTFAEED